LYSRCSLATHWNLADHWTHFSLCCGFGVIFKFLQQLRLYWSCSAVKYLSVNTDHSFTYLRKITTVVYGATE
jgi:hypothetical protein